MALMPGYSRRTREAQPAGVPPVANTWLAGIRLSEAAYTVDSQARGRTCGKSISRWACTGGSGVGRIGRLCYKGSGLIGEWDGKVDGIGNAQPVITAGHAGRANRGPNEIRFAVLRFDVREWNTADRTSRGVVSGSVLTTEAPLGRTYRRTLSDDQLAETYTRGTMFNRSVTLRKPMTVHRSHGHLSPRRSTDQSLS